MLMLLNLVACDSSQQGQAVNSSESSPLQVAEPKAVDEAKPQLQPGDPLPTISSASNEDDGFTEIDWDSLMPEDYRPEQLLMKYIDQLAELSDDDPKAIELYGIMQAELDNAPINTALAGKAVRLPGFIAPLENVDGKVSEFLLVPYFGACIHVPPPPVNQTVLVKTLADSAIDAEDVWEPVWVMGNIQAEGESTDIGNAGYRIMDAKVEIFEY